MMCRWTTRGAERLNRPGARAPREHLEGWFQHDGAVSVWLARFLEAWANDELPPVADRRAASGRGSRRRVRRTIQAVPAPRTGALLSA